MILHIDMDAFYASVEQADNPGLKGKCVIIGGRTGRSVVSAASYEARRFGVRSAMPMFLAKRKCPKAVILPVRMDRYKAVSLKIMDIVSSFSPLVEQVSIDEAYIDAIGCEPLYKSPENIARQIKARVFNTVDMTCSVGVAPNKFLAKVASDLEKPDGLTMITPEEVNGFISVLPIEKVPGVGKKTFETLHSLGIKYLGDVNRHQQSTLTTCLGKYGFRLAELARGVDPSPVSPYRETKSVGSEETFEKDTNNKDILKACLLAHAEEVGRSLRRKHLKAKTVTLKIKHDDFSQATRSRRLKAPVQSAKNIYDAAVQLLDAYPLNKKVRLIGISGANLTSGNTPLQAKLFDEVREKTDNWEKIEQVVDTISEKFGENMVQKAGLKSLKDKRH
jgi:DNA polymerase IV